MLRNWAFFLVACASTGAGCSAANDATEGPAKGANEPLPQAEEETGGAVARFRVANLTPDAPPIDVCLRRHEAGGEAPFDTGPVLRARGLPAGVAYPQISAYVTAPAATFDLRVVRADAVDCSVSLAGVPDQIDLPALGAASRATLVAVGSLARSFFAIDVRGDETEVTSGRAKLRFVHASPSVPALDVGLGSGESFAPLFAGVAFRSPSAGEGTDANGYVEAAPVSDGTLVVRVAGRAYDTLSVPGFALGDGEIASLFSIGTAGMGGRLLQSLLLCSDDDGSSAPLASCATIP